MNIWVPRVKIIEATVEAAVKIHGRYRMQVIRPDGSVRLDTGWFDNLITNGGLDQYYGLSGMSFCYVGSGNTTPAFTDTQLVSLVGTNTSTGSTAQANNGASPYVGTTTLNYVFAPGSATGNLSEIGLGATATTLFSRALIVDNVGSPTTITILANEQLNVSYQLGTIVPLADVTGNITITGIGTVSTTVRAANATSVTLWAALPNDTPTTPGIGGPFNTSTTSVFNAGIGAITAQPTGGLNGCDSGSHTNYVNGSFQSLVSCTYGLSAGNIGGGINSATFAFGNVAASRGQWQVGFGTNIPKDNTHVLTLNYALSWTR